MLTMAIRTLILGLGNELLGDEGVGVHAARSLQQHALPEATKVVDAGTAIIETLFDLEQAERVIILDAMRAGGTPGTVYRTHLADCREKPVIASMHGFDIFRVMALTGRKDLPEITVFGVEPADIGWSLTLSPAVDRAMPHLLAAVENECQQGKVKAGGANATPGQCRC